MNAYSQNGTPDNYQDDLTGYSKVIIPAGQNQMNYSISVPESNSGYTLHFGVPNGYYCWGAYHEGSNYLIDLKNGDKTNADLTFVHGKTISGIVSLPNGIVAPAGGLNVRLESSSDNGTPDTWLDDMGNVANVTIPEGQNQAPYFMEVPESTTGFKLICNANGYMTTYYSQNGGTTNISFAALINLKDGSKDGISIGLKTGNTLNITTVNGIVTKSTDRNVFIDGETVTLTAVPNMGYRFSGWSGDTSGNDSTITVTMDGNKNITAIFTKITTKSIDKLVVPVDQKELKLKPDDEKKIDATVVYKDGSSEILQGAEWSSSNENIATVENGIVTAVGFGKAKITASYMGKKVVIDVDTRLQYLKTNVTELSASPDNSYELTLTAVFSDGTVRDVTADSHTSWMSSNENTATVAQGNVNTKDLPGTATISATYGEKTVKIKVDTRVKNLSPNTKGTIKIKSGGAQTDIKLTATFEDGTQRDVTNDQLTIWSTSNSNVVTVENGTVTSGNMQGSTTITAEYGGSQVKIKISVV